MVSRLLRRLEADIAATKHPLKADCLRVERAAYLARQGLLDDARQVLSSMHMQYAANPNAVMSAWLSLAEGLMSHFSDLGPTAHDRMRRAYALSGAARDMRLHALAAAWLAHMEYAQDELDAMVRHVGESLTLSHPDDHGVRARASLVVAQAYHFGARYDRAQPWYLKARQHANADGDEATLSALMHNMAWLNVSNERQRMLTSNTGSTITPQMLMSAESTGNFDQLVGTASLDALLPILRAQIFALSGRPTEALTLYEQHMEQAMAQGLARMQGALRSDMALCRLQLGEHSRALHDARAAEVATESEVDVDDRAAAHSRLSRVFGELGEAGASERHAAKAAECWAVHEREQASLVGKLDAMLKGLSPPVA